jgi:hypothetical protein
MNQIYEKAPSVTFRQARNLEQILGIDIENQDLIGQDQGSVFVST